VSRLGDKITSGPIKRAKRIGIHGPPAAGKSTLAGKFKGALFFDMEDGTAELDVRRINIDSFVEFKSAYEALLVDHAGVETVVLDPVDSLEKFLRIELCRKYRKTGIEEFAYGKGWTYLVEEFERVLSWLDVLISKGINVVVIGHTGVHRVYLPELPDPFDRYELQLYDRNAARLEQWLDALLFINYHTRTQESSSGRIRELGGKERAIFTTHSAAYDAKNRVNLPEKLPCEFSALLPLFGNSDVSGSLPEVGKEHPDNQPEDTGDAPGQDNGVRGTDDGAANGNAETPQQRLAAALNGEDQELLRLFLLNRKVCSDGLIQSVPEDYANRALENLSRFRERLAKFATQPF
jgi:GTPase SAR1 family protein